MRNGCRNSQFFSGPLWAFVVSFALFLLAPAWADPVPCDPQFKKEAESFDEYCDRQEKTNDSCAGGGGKRLGIACQKAKEQDKQAVTEANKAYKKTCALTRKLEELKSGCTQKECQKLISDTNDDLKKTTAEWAGKLEKRAVELENLVEELQQEVEAAAAPAEKYDAAAAKCRSDGHKFVVRPGVTMEEPAHVNEIKNGVVAIKGSAAGRRNADQFRGVQNAQAETLKQIDNSIAKIRQEAQYLRRVSAAAGQSRDLTTERRNRLGQDNPSTITGNTNKNDMPQQAGGAPPPSGGGAPPQGGGAPSQGGGSQPQDSPSTLSNQESPSSGSEYPAVAREAPRTSQTGDEPNAGSTKLAERNGPEGNGIMDISKISNKSFEPRERGGSREARAGRDRNLAKDQPDPLGGEKKDKSANPADGKVDGSGGAGGGTSSASGKEKAEDETAKAESSDSGDGVNGAGGVSAGGGSEETLTAFGKPLGDPKFSLAGSDTDASIKKMLGDFDGKNSLGENGRELASADGEDGIGDKNGPSLFERCHETHNRCQLKGCVTTHGGRKGG